MEFISKEYYNKLKKVNLKEASRYTENDFETLYNYSGYSIIDDFLKQKYPDCDFFIDMSFVSGAIEDSGLPDFIFAKNHHQFLDFENIKKYYNAIYTKLKEENSGPYYHKDFFYERTDFNLSSFISDNAKSNVGIEIEKTSKEIEVITKNEDTNSFISNQTITGFKYSKYEKEIKNENELTIKESLNTFHTYLNNYFKNNTKKGLQTKLLGLPIVAAAKPTNDNSNPDFLNGQGAIFIYFVSKEEINIDYKLIFNLNAIIKDFSYNYIFYTAELLNSKITKHAIKSAIAAIMARNMSHNLGSHILYYLKNILAGYSNLDIYPFIAELEKNTDANDFTHTLNVVNKKIKIKDVKEENRIRAPFLRGLSRFLSYLQERQDFIATISNNYVPYFGSINFKDFIYDVLKPDLKIERHNTEDKYKENNILLDYIAKSEGFENKDIQINFFSKQGNINPSEAFDGRNKGNDNLELLRKVELDLPGGIMGRQAFFSIFENFIRNSAKHNNNKSDGKLIVSMAFETDDNKDYYCVKLFDNFNTATPSLIETINKAIREPYVKPSLELEPKNKGIKEMRISAAWLRGVNVADIDEIALLDNYRKRTDKSDIPINDLPVLQVKMVDNNGEDKNNEGNICYEFYLPKSKKLLVIVKDEKPSENTNEVDFLSFKKYINSNVNYNIIAYDDSLSKEQINTVNKQASSRTVSIDLKNDELTYIAVYEKWITKNITNARPIICIIDSKINPENYNNQYTDGIKYFSNDGEAEDFFRNSNVEYIVYRVHNDTKAEFEKLMGTVFYQKAVFIEGISGHNSTDRLLRNEVKDKLWYLKMIESAYTKILVIDERMFDNYLDVYNQVKLDYTHAEIDTTSVEKLHQFFKEKEPDEYTKIIENDIFEELVSFIEDNIPKDIINSHKKFLYEDIASLKVKTSSYSFTEKLLGKKNIYINDIIINDSLTQSEIINIDGEKNKFDTDNNDNYHFVFIHQGILDKIYSSNDCTTDDEKNEIFTKFKNRFPIVKKNGFKYIIHSGRSNPEFLPNDVAFSQFSSLDTALNDCKFSLSQIVYASKYYVNPYN